MKRNPVFSLDDLWLLTKTTLAKMNRPENNYQILKEKTALIIVDMQNAFCNKEGCIFIENSSEIINNINHLAKICRKYNMPVFWLKHCVEKMEDYGLWPNFQPVSPVDSTRVKPSEAFINDNGESQIYSRLDVDSRDIVVTKNRYSGFIDKSSEVIELLKDHNIRHLIFSGVGTNVCVESSVRDAMMLGYEVTVVSDGTATTNDYFHNISLMNVKLFFGDVRTAKNIIAEIECV